MRLFASLLLIWLSYTSGSTQTREDTTAMNKKVTSIFYGQPGKAALYSLILPGAGQIYNKRYWKAPLVWAGEGLVAFYLIQSLDRFASADNCWKSLVEDPTMPAVSCGTITDRNTAFTLRQARRSQRERAWIFRGLAHLLNVIEAFVDRHLINFDTSVDLSWVHYDRQESSMVQTFAGIQVFKISIPISKLTR